MILRKGCTHYEVGMTAVGGMGWALSAIVQIGICFTVVHAWLECASVLLAAQTPCYCAHCFNAGWLHAAVMLPAALRACNGPDKPRLLLGLARWQRELGIPIQADRPTHT
jgi:hypothetical protein